MARKYDIEAVLGPDFEFELTPDLLAYELSMDFSNQVIKYCADAGITMGELASLMDVGASTLSEKLNGQNLTLKSIASMAIALNCDVKAPELIAEPDVACSMDASWSLPFSIEGADPTRDIGEAWPALEPAHKAETIVVSDTTAPHRYFYAESLRKVA